MQVKHFPNSPHHQDSNFNFLGGWTDRAGNNYDLAYYRIGDTYYDFTLNGDDFGAYSSGDLSYMWIFPADDMREDHVAQVIRRLMMLGKLHEDHKVIRYYAVPTEGGGYRGELEPQEDVEYYIPSLKPVSTCLLDWLGNDWTGIYRHEGSSSYPADSWEITKAIATGERKVFYYTPIHLSFGDYDNSCHVERSNVRMFLKEFGNNQYVRHHTGFYGHEAVLIDIFCDDEDIIETLSSLYNYPVMNDDDLCKMEREMEDSDWDNWIMRDMIRGIEKEFDVDGIVLDESKLREFYEVLKDKANVYYEVQSGGNGYVDIDRLVDSIDLPFLYKMLDKWSETNG